MCLCVASAKACFSLGFQLAAAKINNSLYLLALIVQKYKLCGQSAARALVWSVIYNIYIYIYVCVYIYVYTYICIYAYIHIYVYTYT